MAFPTDHSKDAHRPLSTAQDLATLLMQCMGLGSYYLDIIKAGLI